MNRINEQFAVLSSRYNVPVRLVAVDDPNAPTQGIREEDGTFVITLNAAKNPGRRICELRWLQRQTGAAAATGFGNGAADPAAVSAGGCRRLLCAAVR